jgi:cytochrome b subunit of formate dehydrogenase
MELFPKAEDAREALANFSYNVGLRSAPPGRSAHSYVEKAEYWAVVWGAMVMIATGVMLWGNNLMLALFPKMWLDVATSVHFYEALLATLAIVVWHFYTVIFDPDVYPMDTAWLTGVSVKEPERTKAPPEKRGAGRARRRRRRQRDNIQMSEPPTSQVARPTFSAGASLQ